LCRGHLNIDRMLEFWKKIIIDAKNADIKRLLLTGEMGWANSNVPGHEQLVPYEDALEHMLEQYPWVTVVCQYPVYQISGVTVYDNLRNHTHSAAGKTGDVFWLLSDFTSSIIPFSGSPHNVFSGFKAVCTPILG